MIDLHTKDGVEFYNKVMSDIGWDADTVDFAACTQVAKWLTEETFKNMGIPIEKTEVALNKLGNVGAAGIPMVICEAVKKGQLKEGNRVLLFGGGAGFSLVCMCMIW